MQMVPDRLWDILEPLLPEEPPKPKGGRPGIENRAVLAGILIVLRTGCPWPYVPQEMGCGCGTTCWRRLRDWQAAGVWARLERELLQRLSDADAIDWSRAAVDSMSIPAKRGRSDRAESNGSRKGGLGAPSCGRCPRSSARHAPHGREGERLGRVRGRAQCDPTPPSPVRRARASTLPAEQGARGQRLRQTALPALSAHAWHHLSDRAHRR
jgi:transposase